MSFVSLAFLVLLATTFLLYWRLGLRMQNLLIVVVSYIFYGWWDWRFLGLMFYTTLVDYLCGIAFADEWSPKARKRMVAFALANNLMILGFFKYFNFFIESGTELLKAFGFAAHPWTLNVILPVGISFYTFQSMSYAIDLWRGQVKPTRDFVQFVAFVSFFPQLVAGPIERASHLLGQFGAPRVFDDAKARDGLRQALWGFFKKVCIADHLGTMVNGVYANPGALDGGYVAAATILFAFQIYCDFSAYSDIAIGTSHLFGIDIMRNFAYPYFSRDMAEFWRRWHISLSTWFRDYVYVPLGGSRVGNGRRILNVMVTFTVSGLWHGAKWTFVAWGFANGLLVLLCDRWRKSAPGTERLRELPLIVVTFLLACLCWVFFRANSMADAMACFRQIFTAFSWASFAALMKMSLWMLLPLLYLEWRSRARLHVLDIAEHPQWLRWTVYATVLTVIYMTGELGHESAFIYFQF